MSVKQDRRDFIGVAFGAVAAVGGAFSLVAMKKTWDPLPSVKAAGFTLESKKRPNTWYREDIGEQKSDRFVIALTVKRR